MPLSSKLIYGDYILDNSGPTTELPSQVDRVVKKLEQRAGWSWRVARWFPPYGIIAGIVTIIWRVGWKRPDKKIGGKKREIRMDRFDRSGGRSEMSYE